MLFISQFESFDSAEIGLLGRKCLNIAKMSSMALNVPRWFCLTSNVFNLFIEALNARNIDITEEKAREISIDDVLPNAVIEELVVRANDLLCTSTSKGLVVRSSSSIEDTESLSFAGQFLTVVGVCSIGQLFDGVKNCWLSSNSSKVAAYLATLQIPVIQSMAVIVQELIDADVSGVMFTANPVSYSLAETVIEANWGLGVTVVDGLVTPDHYVVVNNDDVPQIIERRVGRKQLWLDWDIKNCVAVLKDTNRDEQDSITLTDNDLYNLWRLGQFLQDALSGPQDIEWAKKDGKIYVLQSRPITSLTTVRKVCSP